MSLWKRSEYTLENIVEQNRSNPRTFLKPTDDEINQLKVGSCVKLIFIMRKAAKDGCSAERMWVIVTDIKEGQFFGRLDNSPLYLKTIREGDTIDFSKENIASISFDTSNNIDESKLAIITKRALDKLQINWLIRTDDLFNEQDSGWQLFYGDEEDVYLENTNNAALVSLESVLNFEPLLENVLGQKGNAYQYNDNGNTFMEVQDWKPSE